MYFSGPTLPVEAFGLHFKNPVGLAAGYDKDGIAWRGLYCLGFGHIEVGTVTPLAQPGNPRPRLFRLPEDRALINRMGFPGKGGAFAASTLIRNRPKDLVVGVNLGKNKDTPLETAVLDYLKLMEIFAPLADYLAINVSSPNTIGLRQLQARQSLQELLAELATARAQISGRIGKAVPVLVKLSPDLTDSELDDALQVILSTGMDGVIATNTTIERTDLSSPHQKESGGISGAPLRSRGTEMIKKIVERTQYRLPVIGVGGVMSAIDVQEKLDAGAALVQVYTGLVYAGPSLVKDTLEHLNSLKGSKN